VIYRLSRPARGDLGEIWRYSAATWGTERADTYIDAMISRFVWLAVNRPLWRERSDVRPGLYSYPQGRHVILFRERSGAMDIVRILHDRMDIRRHV
jgi:toxin ParE1/3/4